MSDNDDLINQFMDVTGVTKDRAKFYIESSNSNLQLALSTFFEGDHDVPEETGPSNEPSMPVDEPHEVEMIDDDDDDDDDIPIRVSSKEKKKKSKKRSNNSNVATLFTMNRSSSEDDDEEEGQAFYAGGSERSGQQVLGPPRRKQENDIVSEVFRSAQESGAEVIEHRRGQPSTSSSLYSGTGYRLGMTSEDHEVLPGARPNRPQTIEPFVLKLWRQGFSINNGELRHYENPANREFLNCIMKGEIPSELRQMAGGGTVDLELEDHRNEEFKKMPSKQEVFTGKGHTLGSPAPNVVENEIQDSSSNDPNNIKENEEKAASEVKIDDNQPTTMIQVRLSDGTRLSGRFNHTHTISDIRRFIITSRPAYQDRSFNLLTTFPSKELSDENATIKDAGLLGAAILQRLK